MPFNSQTYEKHLDAQLGDWAFVIELAVFIFCFVIIPLFALGSIV